ncbi:MAG: hypothetical protein K8I27_05290 [Planctomycetes bacterium]|nr:hypothetical protein [Planctomycetota bacterium]
MLRDFQPRFDLHAARQRLAHARGVMRTVTAEIIEVVERHYPTARDSVTRKLALLFSDYEAAGHLAMSAKTVLGFIQDDIQTAMLDAEPDYSDAEAHAAWEKSWRACNMAFDYWRNLATPAEETRDGIENILPSLLLDLARAWGGEIFAQGCVDHLAEQSGAVQKTGPPDLYKIVPSDAESGARLSRFAAAA